nr:hypothetical protein [Sulfolobus sp. E5-1-F]
MTRSGNPTRTYVRSAFKNLLSLFSLIFLSLPDEKVKKILRTLLKARGRYLSELGNEGKYTLNALNSVKAENVINAIEEQAKKLLKRQEGSGGLPRNATIPQIEELTSENKTNQGHNLWTSPNSDLPHGKS